MRYPGDRSARATLCLIAGALAIAAFTYAQTIGKDEVRVTSGTYRPESQVLSSESRVVRIDAVVRDGKGQVVPGLKSGDFAIFDDGKRQAISTFQVENHTPIAFLSQKATSGALAPAHAQQLSRPRYVTLYFDDLHTKWGDLKHVQEAARNFVLHGLEPQDRVAVATSSSTVTLDFTTDTAKMLDAVNRLQPHERVFDSLGCPRITAQDAYLIANFPTGSILASGDADNELVNPGYTSNDAYGVALREAEQCNCSDNANIEPDCARQQQQLVLTLAKQIWQPTQLVSQDTLNTIRAVVSDLATKSGERVLVLASAGFLTGTMENQVDTLMSDALRQEIVINALDAKGLYTEDPGHGRIQNEMSGETMDFELEHEGENFDWKLMAANAAMVDFTVGTGGRFFHDRNDLTAGYYSLAVAPDTEYLLGFVPENSKSNGAFHKLRVEVNAPGKCYVQARPGYFAPARERTKETREQRIDAEVRGNEERNDFPVSVTEEDVGTANGMQQLRIHTHIDIARLPFHRENGRRVDMLTLVVALFDAGGQVVAGKEAQIQLALRPADFELLSREGVGGATFLEAPPGQYRLRVLVQEAEHGTINATSQSVKVD